MERSCRVTDPDSNNASYNLLDGVLRFDVYFDETGDLNALQEKNYFLDLPPWENNRSRDVDTLILTLGITETNSSCTSHRFNYLKFAYNGEVTFAGDPDTLDGREYLLGRK